MSVFKKEVCISNVICEFSKKHKPTNLITRRLHSQFPKHNISKEAFEKVWCISKRLTILEKQIGGPNLKLIMKHRTASRSLFINVFIQDSCILQLNLV